MSTTYASASMVGEESDKRNIISEFVKELRKESFAKSFSKINEKNLGEFMGKPLTVKMLEYEAHLFVDMLTSFIEKKAREKAGVEDIKVATYPYGAYGENSILHAYVETRIGGEERKILVYEDPTFIKDFVVAENIEEFKKILTELPEKIAEESLRVLRELGEREKIYWLITRGYSGDEKLVSIEFKDLNGYVDDTLLAIAPKDLTEDKLQKIVDEIKKKLPGIWSTADIYRELEEKYNIKFIKHMEDFKIEI